MFCSYFKKLFFFLIGVNSQGWVGKRMKGWRSLNRGGGRRGYDLPLELSVRRLTSVWLVTTGPLWQARQIDRTNNHVSTT